MSDTHPPQVPGHRLERVIGSGAAGVVWAGRDATGRPVAVKVPHTALDEVERRQAEVERHVLMAVRHDHLVGLRDVVPIDLDRVALVFDLVDGEPLPSIVRARGALRPGETVTVVTPIAGAIAALHAAGGIHGDVSAGNVRLTADGRPVLLDLGSARLMGSAARLVGGTSGFVAPEVRLGSDPGRPADVFGLGAVAWFCLTGNGAPDTDLRLDPATVESHVGPELAEVIGRCIDPDPRRRPTAGEVADLCYAAVPAEPVEVVVGPDAASALTHRLRAGAAREADETVGGSAPRARVPGWRAVVDGAAQGGSRARGIALVVAVLAALGVAVAIGYAPSGASGAITSTPTAASLPSVTGPSPSPSASALPVSEGAPDVAAVSPSSTMATGGVLADASAPGRRTAELVEALSGRRADALVGRDPGALDGYCVVDGEACAADADLIGQLRSAGLRWEGLRAEVVSAFPLDVGTTVATVRATVGWTAHTEVADRGDRVQRPADPGRALDLTLRRDGPGAPGQWRIGSISSAPAS
ncbi:MAG: protein kinase [Terracoccus sp.]